MTITKTLNLSRGPVMIGVSGYSLNVQEIERLCHPLIGGVILFRRNFQNKEQLTALVEHIHALRNPALLVAVDHEGGRVQRFVDGFTRLPAMAKLGEIWQSGDPEKALNLAKIVGYVLAAELRACGIDLSFTPVLDLDWGRSEVIGDRSFSKDPHIVSELAFAVQQGLARGGMASCGKHFPGHGWVKEDSHKAIAEDERSLAQIQQDDDIQPFVRLARQGMQAIMPAHVIYPAVDSNNPAGFSAIWLKAILRGEFHFEGLIFSDDLCMEGASSAGDITERAKAAFKAGCDVVLVCNRPDLVDELLLANLTVEDTEKLAGRLKRLQGEGDVKNWQSLVLSDDFINLTVQINELTQADNFSSGDELGEN